AVNVINHHLDLPPDGDECLLDVHLASVQLGSGTWYVRVGLAKAGLFEGPTIKYFAVDAGWHHLMREGIQLEVLSVGHLDASGCSSTGTSAGGRRARRRCAAGIRHSIRTASAARAWQTSGRASASTASGSRSTAPTSPSSTSSPTIWRCCGGSASSKASRPTT